MLESWGVPEVPDLPVLHKIGGGLLSVGALRCLMAGMEKQRAIMAVLPNLSAGGQRRRRHEIHIHTGCCCCVRCNPPEHDRASLLSIALTVKPPNGAQVCQAHPQLVDAPVRAAAALV